MDRFGSVDQPHPASERPFVRARGRRAVADEERQARAAQRRRQAAARVAAARRWRRLLTRVIAETKTRECSCPLHAHITREELVALGAGCTEPHCICPRLAKVRRRVGL